MFRNVSLGMFYVVGNIIAKNCQFFGGITDNDGGIFKLAKLNSDTIGVTLPSNFKHSASFTNCTFRKSDCITGMIDSAIDVTLIDCIFDDCKNIAKGCNNLSLLF